MNESNNSKDNLQDSVRKAIEDGKVTMRPRWHFVVRTALLVVGTVLAALTVLYLVSFIIFILRQTGVIFAPGFGLRGVNVFLMSMPWLLVGIATLFILLLQVLVKKYSFSYERPLMYSAFGIMVVVIAGGFIVSATSLHGSLFSRAEKQRLPVAGGFYRQFGEKKFKEITVGVVTEVTETGCRMRTPHRDDVAVTVTSQTAIPRGYVLKQGDSIAVLGKRDGNAIKAVGLKEIVFEGMALPPPGFYSEPRNAPR